jgi:integrase
MDVRRYVVAQMLFPAVRYSDLPSLKLRADDLVRLCQRLASTSGDRRLNEVNEGQLGDAFAWMASSRGKKTRSTLCQHIMEVKVHAATGNIPRGFDLVSERHVVSLAADGVDGLPARPESDQEESYGKWRHLPDAYLAEAGRIWSYYLQEILPNLATLLSEWGQLHEKARGRRRTDRRASETEPKSAMLQRRAKLWQARLSEFQWIDAKGSRIERLPFTAPLNFPPRGARDLQKLFSAVQSSLMHTLCLLSGGRASEITALPRACLQDEPSSIDQLPTLKGRTFKGSAMTVGDQRNWPIPVATASAIRLLQEIGGKLAPDSPHLWIGSQGNEQFQSGVALYFHVTTFPGNHGILHLLDNIPAHPHRFRKSIARLAVLSLVGAPMILRDIFGHADLESVLKYILADPEIRREMRAVAQEVALEQADTIAEELDEAGGRGADLLRATRDELYKRLEVPQNERQQRRRMDEFVSAILSDGGIELKMIFPGIICTKPKAARGACNAGDDIAPSSCQAGCEFYCSLPSRRQDTEHTIEWLIGELGRPEITTNPLLVQWYGAQLYDQVRIYADFRERYLADPRYHAALRLERSVAAS